MESIRRKGQGWHKPHGVETMKPRRMRSKQHQRLGQICAELRCAAGLSKAEMFRLLGWKRHGSVSDYELGTRALDVFELAAILKATAPAIDIRAVLALALDDSPIDIAVLLK